MNTLISLAVFSAVTVTTALFLSIYVLSVFKGDRLLRVFLVALLLAISIRISKSVLYYLFGIPMFGTALGMLGLSTIGVFSWLYADRFCSEGSNFSRWNWLHFVLPVTGFLLIWPEIFVHPTLLYFLGAAFSLLYVIVAAFRVMRENNRSGVLFRWHVMLFTSVGLILMAFIGQLWTDGLVGYAIGAALASLQMYLLFYVVLKNNKLFVRSREPQTQVDAVLQQKLRDGLEHEGLYRQSSLTVYQLAEHLGEPHYKVALALKELYGRPFPELINHFRVEDVKRRLMDPKHHNLKVEALAFDAGFSTPSAFYVAFKRETGVTPRAFQRSHSTSELAQA